VVRRGVKAALEAKASALVIDMNTPGGEGEAMKEVMATIAKFQPADRTYTYVNKEAFSAGAFISASTRQIWMAPGSIIGAASPVTLGQEGPKELPPKFVSGYAALIRAAAEQNGHNPAVFDAMVNKQIGLRLDGREIVAKGDILTLTTQEATRQFGTPPRTILAAGVSPDLKTFIEKNRPTRGHDGKNRADRIRKHQPLDYYDFPYPTKCSVSFWISRVQNPRIWFIRRSLRNLCFYFSFRSLHRRPLRLRKCTSFTAGGCPAGCRAFRFSGDLCTGTDRAGAHPLCCPEYDGRSLSKRPHAAHDGPASLPRDQFSCRFLRGHNRHSCCRPLFARNGAFSSVSPQHDIPHRISCNYFLSFAPRDRKNFNGPASERRSKV